MGKRRNRNRVNATGRNNTSRFVRLDYRILNSNAYRSLSPNARSLLVELVMLYNGENNGSLYLSVRDAARAAGYDCGEKQRRRIHRSGFKHRWMGCSSPERRDQKNAERQHFPGMFGQGKWGRSIV